MCSNMAIDAVVKGPVLAWLQQLVPMLVCSGQVCTLPHLVNVRSGPSTVVFVECVPISCRLSNLVAAPCDHNSSSVAGSASVCSKVHMRRAWDGLCVCEQYVRRTIQTGGSSLQYGTTVNL